MLLAEVVAEATDRAGNPEEELRRYFERQLSSKSTSRSTASGLYIGCSSHRAKSTVYGSSTKN